MRVEAPIPPEDKVRLFELRVATRPDGEMDTERVTVPEKLLRLARLIVDVPEEPD